MEKIAVVIPCYRVTEHVLGVISLIDDRVWRIYAIDDCCPDGSGNVITAQCSDSRVRVLRHETNQGVGGAVMTGYKAAIADGVDIIVKVDGDGQMDPALLWHFVEPICKDRADYTKGNRFYDLTFINRMPTIRIIGNAALSFLTKISTGYWTIFDPTNGYTAIHARVAASLPFDRISRRYFFETDMLFRLNTIRAVVFDVPMHAKYGDEQSNLKIGKILPEFIGKHIKNLGKRIFYNYFLRDMTVASFELVSGSALFLFGTAFGIAHWISGIAHNRETPFGTIIVSTLCVLIGLQLLLAFIGFDVANVPQRPIHDSLPGPLGTPSTRTEDQK